jgi:virginiamycin B lyase
LPWNFNTASQGTQNLLANSGSDPYSSDADIDVDVLVSNAVASGATNQNNQGYHFYLQYGQDPQKHKTFWVACVPQSAVNPTAVTASIACDSTSAIINWAAPATTGGPYTSYTVTSSPGGLTATVTGTSASISGLTMGTTYTFTVTATNAAGTSLVSVPSNPVTPGHVVEYGTLPSSNSSPHGIAYNSVDGNMWFTELAGRIGKITPSGLISEYPIPGGGVAFDIAQSPNGAMWITFHTAGQDFVGQVTTAGVFTLYPVVTPSSASTVDPFSIAAGSDGNMWITLAAANKVASVTPGGIITYYTIPLAGAYPNDIAPGPDGQLWLSLNNYNDIGKVSTSGVFTIYPSPAGFNLYSGSVVAGSDGNLWYTQSGGNPNNLAKVSTSGVFLALYSIPGGTSGSNAIAIAPAADGTLWITLSANPVVENVTTSGVFTQYTLPTPTNSGGDYPYDIAFSPTTGTMWFTETNGNSIAKACP